MTDVTQTNIPLENNPIRTFVAQLEHSLSQQKFVKREIRRGNKYDAIVMDPPSYGRGKNGEVWIYLFSDIF